MNHGKRIQPARVLSRFAIPIVLAVGWMATACPAHPGVATPGFWINHPNAWPVEQITIGGNDYTKAEAIAAMQTPPAGDKTFTLFRDVVAALLNNMVGNSIECVESYKLLANEWLADHPVASGVAASSAAWKEAEPWHLELDAYNNGERCAPSREEVEAGNGVD